MTQHLTILDTIAANRRAIENNTLAAIVLPGVRGCMYRRPTNHNTNCFCGIGAALTTDTLDAIELRGCNTQAFSAISVSNYVDCDNDDVRFFEALQYLHDSWQSPKQDLVGDLFSAWMVNAYNQDFVAEHADKVIDRDVYIAFLDYAEAYVNGAH